MLFVVAMVAFIIGVLLGIVIMAICSINHYEELLYEEKYSVDKTEVSGNSKGHEGQ